MKLLDIGHRLVAGGLMVATVGGFGALYSGYASWSAHMRKLKTALAAAEEPAASAAAAAVATAAATNEKVA